MSLGITDLEQSFPGFDLGPISLTVDDEVVSVLGPSGCGKTTFLSLIAGFQQPTAGDITLHGRSVTGLPPEHRKIAMVFQEGALFPHLTARENIAYAASDAGRVTTVAKTLDIESVLDRPATALSGGERQRVALARALAADPPAVLLDEPLANLDAPVRQRLRGDVRALLADLGVPVIHVTHDQRAAAAIGDRIAVMHDGGLDHVGTPDSIFTSPATPFVARFTGSTVFTAAVDADHMVTWADTQLTAAPPELGPGESVTVAVRPDRLHLHLNPPPEQPTVVTGQVTQRVFEGDRHRLTIAVTDGSTPLTLTLPPTTDHIPALDDQVHVEIPKHAVYVIQAPPGTRD